MKKPPRSADDLLKKLDYLASLKTGDPIPDWLPHNDWGAGISELCRDAAKEIRELRAKTCRNS